jgi:transcriptional regulator with XRE-family HTH domain
MVDFSKAAETKALIEKMLARGLSQAEVGRRLGISRGQVYNIKSGRTGVGKFSIKQVEAWKSVWGELKVTEAEFNQMAIPREYYTITVTPANERARTLIGRYWHGLRDAKAGDRTFLEKYCEGKKVECIDEKGRRFWLPLITDEETLKRLDDEGQLDVQAIAYGQIDISTGVLQAEYEF